MALHAMMNPEGFVLGLATAPSPEKRGGMVLGLASPKSGNRRDGVRLVIVECKIPFHNPYHDVWTHGIKSQNSCRCSQPNNVGNELQ